MPSFSIWARISSSAVALSFAALTSSCSTSNMYSNGAPIVSYKSFSIPRPSSFVEIASKTDSMDFLRLAIYSSLAFFSASYLACITLLSRVICMLASFSGDAPCFLASSIARNCASLICCTISSLSRLFILLLRSSLAFSITSPRIPIAFPISPYVAVVDCFASSAPCLAPSTSAFPLFIATFSSNFGMLLNTCINFCFHCASAWATFIAPFVWAPIAAAMPMTAFLVFSSRSSKLFFSNSRCSCFASSYAFATFLSCGLTIFWRWASVTLLIRAIYSLPFSPPSLSLAICSLSKPNFSTACWWTCSLVIGLLASKLALFCDATPLALPTASAFAFIAVSYAFSAFDSLKIHDMELSPKSSFIRFLTSLWASSSDNSVPLLFL